MGNATTKRCRVCGEVKSEDCFNFTGYTKADGTKSRRNECKDCQRIRQNNSRKASKAKGELKYDAKWYAANKQRVIERVREWRKYNMDKAYNYSARSRAKHRYNTVGSHTEEEWQEVLKEFNYSCMYCGSKENITKDHIIPLSKGGTDDIENIGPACKSCNSSKGNKTLEEWLDI